MANHKDEYPDPDMLHTNNVVSTTECTGLFQGLPVEDEQIEAFSDIYDVPDQGSLGKLEEKLNKVMERQSKKQ